MRSDTTNIIRVFSLFSRCLFLYNLVWIFPLTWFNNIFAWLKSYHVWIILLLPAMFFQSVYFFFWVRIFSSVKLVFVCQFGFIVRFFISWLWSNVLLVIHWKYYKNVLYLDELCKHNILEWNSVAWLLSYLFHFPNYSNRSENWRERKKIKALLNQNIRLNWFVLHLWSCKSGRKVK